MQAAQVARIEQRQSYGRVGRAAELQVGGYAHAKQYWRVRRELKGKLQTARRLYEQRCDSKSKLYPLHAPEVGGLAKGKARTPYEFGVNGFVAVNAEEGPVVGMRSMPGNPYHGHTVNGQLEQRGSGVTMCRR